MSETRLTQTLRLVSAMHCPTCPSIAATASRPLQLRQLVRAALRAGREQASRLQLALAGSSPGRVLLHAWCCLNAPTLRQWRFCLAGMGREIRPALRNLRLSLP